MSRILPAVCGPDARQHLQEPEACDAVTGVLCKAQDSQACPSREPVEELQSSELYEGDVAAGQFHFEGAAVARGAEEDACCLRSIPDSRLASTCSTMQFA